MTGKSTNQAEIGRFKSHKKRKGVFWDICASRDTLYHQDSRPDFLNSCRIHERSISFS